MREEVSHATQCPLGCFDGKSPAPKATIFCEPRLEAGQRRSGAWFIAVGVPRLVSEKGACTPKQA